MSKIKKKRRVSIKLDMTPMVDIAFLLLIFYMATTQFKPPEAKAVELPTSHSQIELPKKDIINVTVSALDSIYVDWIERVPMIVEGVQQEVKARRVRTVQDNSIAVEIGRGRAVNPKALVVVKADAGASFGRMQDVMSQMQDININQILVITSNELE